MTQARSLMVVGTSSNVGKSLVVAAVCRLLVRRGYRVAPFKAQNMSLNAYVTADGGEIGYAQALQAWGAGVPPHVDMNPILLKPQGDMTSQIILHGKAVGTYRAGDYYETFFDRGWKAVTETLDRLSQQYDWIVCEGAGSPAEVNLRHRDLTNMRVAKYLQAPTWLVADIDRGGALAHVVGTLQVLPEDEQRLFAGLVINKFRGVLDLLQPGLDWLEEYTGVPIVGVLPWLEFALPAEDSMSLFERRGKRSTAESEIAVIRLPRIANFTDFDPLAAEPTVRVRFVGLSDPLGQPDVVILPGSKATISDLQALQESGMAAQIQAYAIEETGAIAGICGGMQMLGNTIRDPDGFESTQGDFSGLRLLPLETTFTGDKITQQVSMTSRWPAEAPLSGYEIHQGLTEFGDGALPLCDRPDIGCVLPSGQIWGTYLHGIFDNHTWRRQWLNQVRSNRGLRPLPILEGHYSDDRDRLLDRLADAWTPHLKLDALLD